MNDNSLITGEMGTLEHDLRGLREMAAPATLLPAVLAAVGLTDAYFPLETPIGTVFVAYNRRGISAVMLAADGGAFEQVFEEQFGRPVQAAAEPPADLQRAVIEHLQGKRRDLRFDLRGLSEFEQAVLHKALEIPRGEVRPYAWIAREIGRPKAVRAVGTALANNPVPLVIPCHRVVRSDGIIGQYGLGGSANKRGMLEAEGVDPGQLLELSRQGVRYLGSDTTKIYCFPTCRNARRITTQHRRHFHSGAEAGAAGYRPCKVCRPAVVAMGA
jgi:O-6-methylguanine DNA methyltransferase